MKHTEKRCPNCGQALRFLSNWRQFSGQDSILIGALSIQNPLSTVEAGVWACPDCGKLELYLMEQKRAELDEGDDSIAQVKCPYCGYTHDIDDPKCPLCGNRLDGSAGPARD